MKRALLLLLLFAPLSFAGEVCSTNVMNSCGDGAGGGGTVTSPVATDPLSFTGVVTFDNAANTPVTLSDGATGTALVGTTSTCGGGAVDAANSVCLTANTITGEGATANAFETLFSFGDATADQDLRCTGAASSLGCVVQSPAQVASSTAGNALAFTASPAIAGASNAGAAVGGDITFTAGAAARLTSGNANGGSVNFVTGAGIGTGTAGQVVFPVGAAAAPSVTFSGDTDTGMYWPSANSIAWSTLGALSMQLTTNNAPVGLRLGTASLCFGSAVGTPNGCLSYGGATNILSTSGSVGASDLRIDTGLLTGASMTAETTAYTRTVTSTYTWTNAQVVALGAALTGDITVATLPAKTQLLDAAVIITGAAAGPTTLTVSCGDAIGGTPFINLIVASDAKAAANTVYGDAAAERGTSIDTEFFYLPSYTATTLVTCHFIATVANLNTTTGSTGRVMLTTRLLP